ncbi:MAG: hypothetical protein M3515_06325 [Actinomycetota bacterium]|nr:hypothetical protein [Actinomycetota bacterium]
MSETGRRSGQGGGAAEHERPMWVRGGLWGPLFIWGGAFVVSAAWYWSSIRWVDCHGEWSRPSD